MKAVIEQLFVSIEILQDEIINLKNEIISLKNENTITEANIKKLKKDKKN